ncbi:hypothetical protein [Dactylosporangium aurantiacum]|uniref:hypothetical protein n=1 Tax=Dactylosporangium aurantiacum TaxID=35754 RepID=UPI0006933850|nr:hypothetical protein [Dactylosporangium aurantiacum]MDG6104699.1 hypothetical protein [Dactylosporangium aurantiacum]
MAGLDGWTAAERTHALWQLILEGMHSPDVGPTAMSRRRRALQAAFRLPDAEIHGPWGGSLTERFKQLRSVKTVFGDPTSTQPMEMAWKRGVRALARYLEDRFGELAAPADWGQYRPDPSDLHRFQDSRPEDWQSYFDELNGTDTVFRKPSKGAQPVFVDLFVTTVFMRRRAVYRRITERLVTAKADGVAYYTARGFAGKTPRLTYVPVRALWGCRAEFVEPRQAGRPPVTRLWFPAPLRKGEQAHFASEVIDENITEERYWIDVDIDHHGIAPGHLLYGGKVPVSGLTIRVRFDEGCLPEAVWWYAELNEIERYDPPPPEDRRYVDVVGNDVQHTFTHVACQPRESYGLAFKWPERR